MDWEKEYPAGGGWFVISSPQPDPAKNAGRKSDEKRGTEKIGARWQFINNL